MNSFLGAMIRADRGENPHACPACAARAELAALRERIGALCEAVELYPPGVATVAVTALRAALDGTE